MKRRGFTLIELLVVIVTLSILISLLFPMIGKGLAIAKRSSCGANLRAVTQAHYANFGENGPEFVSSRLVIGNFPPSESLLVEQGLISTNSFICPADDLKRNTTSNPGRAILPAWFSYTRNGYSMNPGVNVPVDVVRSPSEEMLMMEEWEMAPMNDAYVLPNNWDILTSRHNGLGGIGFCDGHVEFINAEGFNSAPSSWRIEHYFNP